MSKCISIIVLMGTSLGTFLSLNYGICDLDGVGRSWGWGPLDLLHTKSFYWHMVFC